MCGGQKLYLILYQYVNLYQCVSIYMDPNYLVSRYLVFYRLFYIARAYSSAKKWTEAIALYQRALDCAQKALTGYKKLTDTQCLVGKPFLFLSKICSFF